MHVSTTISKRKRYHTIQLNVKRAKENMLRILNIIFIEKNDVSNLFAIF